MVRGNCQPACRAPRSFTRYKLGFSLYERAWTMRGMTDLLMDMIEEPEFVERLLDAIVEHNLGANPPGTGPGR